MYMTYILHCTENLTGLLVLRCAKSGKTACKFFLWEEDEPTERDIPPAEDHSNRQFSSSPLGSPTVQTPSSSRNRPTPASTTHSSIRAFRSSERDSSPTPSPKCEAYLTGSPQLTKDVFKILESNNIILKRSTREQLRCVIDSEIRIHETKVENLQESNSALGDQLDQLEIKDHQ